MQSASLFPDNRLEDIHHRLLAHYGPPPPRELWDPLTQMIYSMLSSRTKTPISHAVLRALRERFGTWEKLRDASLPEVEDTIRPVTFPEPKAVNLKAALVSITVRCGSLDLHFLARYRTEKIRAWLEAFDGVGVKTSAAIVNFSTLRRRSMCVDSHHLRIVQRLCFVNKGATAREAEARIMETTPAEWSASVLDDHHSLIYPQSQRCCTKNHPRCLACPLRNACPVGVNSTDRSNGLSKCFGLEHTGNSAHSPTARKAFDSRTCASKVSDFAFPPIRSAELQLPSYLLFLQMTTTIIRLTRWKKCKLRTAKPNRVMYDLFSPIFQSKRLFQQSLDIRGRNRRSVYVACVPACLDAYIAFRLIPPTSRTRLYTNRWRDGLRQYRKSRLNRSR